MKINPAYQARSKNLNHPTQWCSPLSQFLKTTSAKQKMHSHFIYPFESTSQSIQNEKKTQWRTLFREWTYRINEDMEGVASDPSRSFPLCVVSFAAMTWTTHPFSGKVRRRRWERNVFLAWAMVKEKGSARQSARGQKWFQVIIYG